MMGKKDGNGIYYFNDGVSVKYKGGFRNGSIDGFGVHYYENGNVMFSGNWEQGEFKYGQIFSKHGKLLSNTTSHKFDQGVQLVKMGNW